MASSSSEIERTYDIFLSYRGLDTRKKFTGYLYEALKQEGFNTFIDDDDIERGENIKSELQKAICNSKMSIIVLSKNYANSTACLFETQTIIEQRKQKPDHFILPVFYEVDPGEIKEQARTLDFGGKKVMVEEAKGWRAALKRFIFYVLFMIDPWEINEQAEYFDFGGKKVKVEEVEGWSAALKEVGSMAGMVSGKQSNRYEAEFIAEIIAVVERKQAGITTDLAENMKNLIRKVEYLSSQEDDTRSKISNAEHWTWKRKKKEVKVWLMDVQRLKQDVQKLERTDAREMDFCSRIRLGKDIVKKIQEVSELEKKGKDFGDLLIDERTTRRLPLPPLEDFLMSAEGRNVENIWKRLMNDDDRMIGVYGMGGIGKTTIMKHIHNKLLKAKDKFNTVYWVTVSSESDVTKLQSSIAKVLNFSLSEDEDVTIRASQLYNALLRQKRYILIFDDLWKGFILEAVGIPKPTKSNGCKLVLTTRSVDVCRRMGCTTIIVELLTEEEALRLFLRKAAGHGIALDLELLQIANQICKECARLPLAIVAVAGSLRGVKGTRVWRNALNKLMNSTKDASDEVSRVLEQLKFSYRRLENMVLQDCFLYCSLYPEDHKIPVKELIDYWIAEGLIVEMNSMEEKYDEGHDKLRKLTDSCLLESLTEKDEPDFVRMHDLIRDMALSITRSCPRFMTKAGVGLKCISYEVWSEDLVRVSLMHNWIHELTNIPLVCHRLTTLLLNANRLRMIPDSIFTNMPNLEVLDLSRTWITSLPKSISNLEHLHVIILDYCKELEDVPSLEKLKALKEFTLTNSRIKKLPEGIEELDNLIKLDLSGNGSLQMCPGWILQRLSKLQYLKLVGIRAVVLAEDLMFLRQLKAVGVDFHKLPELTRYMTSQQVQGLEKYYLTLGTCRSATEFVLDDRTVCISSKFLPSGTRVDQLVLPGNISFFELHGFHDPQSLSAIPSLKDAIDLRKCHITHCMRLESIFSASTFPDNGRIFLEELSLLLLPRLRVLFDGIALLQPEKVGDL